MQKLINEFNTQDTLLVLTSFPERGGEVAVENAIARYSNLLIKNFPEYQKVVVICENRGGDEAPYLLTKNILVVPSYKVNSAKFALEVLRTALKFSQARSLLVQFEFSIYGGKRVVPSFCLLLALAKLLGKSIFVMLHQVVDNIEVLSGHLGLKKGGLPSRFFNLTLGLFYSFLGAVSTRLLVHDNFLAQRLGYFVDAEKIQVIAHGTSGAKRLTKKTRQNARRELGIADDETAVLVFGYRSWYKGTDWIVKNLAEVIQENPKAKIKFILAGGDSPTLRDTTAYKAFTRRLSGLLESHQKRVITLGFVPEKNVKDLFASCDIVVFPYRARMSASGALSLAFGYGKPVLVSKPFSENFVERDIENVFKYNKVEPERLSFRLSKAEFENKLFSLLANKRLLVSLAKAGFEIADKRSWKNIAALYLAVCTSPAGAVELAKEQGLSYATQES